MGNCKSISTQNGYRKLTLAIVGLDNAGKTVTAKSLLGESVESTTPTIGFSSVSFEFEKHNITLFDLGGGRNIRDIWKKYFAEIHGLIYVVDASAPGRLRECREVLERLIQEDMVKGKPFLLLANKQDVKGSLDEREVCQHLHLEDLVNKYKTPCRVEACSAQRPRTKKTDDTIQNGLKWMVEQIDSKWIDLSRRVETDVGKKERNEKKEKDERMERVRRSRELRDKEEPTRYKDDDDDYDRRHNPFKPINKLSSSQKQEPSIKASTTSYRDYDFRDTRKDDSYYTSAGRSSTLQRRKSIDDDLYQYPGRATSGHLKALEYRSSDTDNYRQSSSLSNQRKPKTMDDDDLYEPYTSGRVGLQGRSRTLAPISSSSRKNARDDSDRDSDSDRPVTRNGHHSVARNVTPPPLNLPKYGSLEGLSGRRSSALAPISSQDKKKPSKNQTAPLDPPRYTSSYDSKPLPSSLKSTSGYMKSSQPSRLDRLDEYGDSSYGRNWKLADDLPDSDDYDDDRGRRPQSRGAVRLSSAKPNSDSYYRNDYR